MYNIKQITNFEAQSLPSGTKTVKAGGDQGHYKEVTYKIITFPRGTDKFGYCCEPKAIQYPIWIRTSVDDNIKEYQIGKTGMFEVQPEEWQNVNDPDSEEEILEIFIKEVWVPWQWNAESDPNEYGYNFKLDYAYDPNKESA